MHTVQCDLCVPSRHTTSQWCHTDVDVTSSRHIGVNTTSFPRRKWRHTAPTWRHHIASTSVRRHFNVVWLLGSNVNQKTDIKQNSTQVIRVLKHISAAKYIMQQQCGWRNDKWVQQLHVFFSSFYKLDDLFVLLFATLQDKALLLFWLRLKHQASPARRVTSFLLEVISLSPPPISWLYIQVDPSTVIWNASY